MKTKWGHVRVIGMKKNLLFIWWKGEIIKQNIDISKLTVLIKVIFLAKLSLGIR